ncbi:MAG: T9SS type A sorting domain-containing protein, partial [Bacteroidales bacterium]|nr:T9SS type A sorting domain-containing protein [Bacteroidales bacterium]
TLIKSQETIHSIEIFDMMGRIVKTQEIHSNEAVISLNHLPRGLYLVKTLMKNGKKQVEKLLLQ